MAQSAIRGISNITSRIRFGLLFVSYLFTRWWYVSAFLVALLVWALWPSLSTTPRQPQVGPGQYVPPAPLPTPAPSQPPTAAGRGSGSAATVPSSPAPYTPEIIPADELPKVAKPFDPPPFATVPDNLADRPYRPYRLDRD